MATRPELNEAVAGQKNKASEYNENFTLMMGYIEDNLTESKNYVDAYMPSVTGQSGKFLTNNGTTVSWDIAVPAGFIGYYGHSSAPSGWFICDGSAVSRTTYADLFSAIGTNFGSGDGSTTFNLPNLIDKFPQGNTTVGTTKTAGLPNITGSIETPHGSVTGAFTATKLSNSDIRGASGSYSRYRDNFDASLSNSIYGNSTTVQPPALTLLPIIKY